MGVEICEPLVEGKGVHGDMKSEGSPRQNLGLRYTNHIRGSYFRMSLHNKIKSKISLDKIGINVADK
ncbi:hypothetical protein COC46_21655 [Bacillus sp. AFS041924]|nr:hypothetical protein COC46_21655 [Bacillus sp. AFS041924]